MSWANAKATLAAALTAAGAGGTVYVSDNHAETQASAMTLTSPGTAASPVTVLCVDDSAEPPTALATTGTVSTTGNTSGITFGGFAHSNGVTYSAGGGGTSTANITLTGTSAWWKIENGRLKLASTGTNSRIVVSSAAQTFLELENTVLEFSSISHGITPRGRLFWKRTASAIAGTVPTNLFPSASNLSAIVSFCGIDLSAAATNLMGNAGAIDFHLENCKLASGVVINGGNIGSQGDTRVTLVNCDSSDTNYRYYRQTYQGEISHETTIVRTGGASDGTTPVSRKMVSTANAKFYSPLVDEVPVTYWNETVGSSVTITIPIITDNVTLKDSEAWVEVEYLGTSGFPLSLFASDRAADILATGVNQATDSSSTWTTTGLGTPVKQSLSVSITPQEKGLIRARVMLAKASTTLYYDPLITVGAGREFMVGAGGFMNEAGGDHVICKQVNQFIEENIYL